MQKRDWEGQEPIESHPCGIHGGHWYPAIEIYKNDGGKQKFILHDETSFNRYPVERDTPYGIDLKNPDVLIDAWRDLRKEAYKEDD